MTSLKHFLRRHRKTLREYRAGLLDRLMEPLHINAVALFFSIFGSLRRKIDFDLILRKQHAFALLDLADQARRLRLNRATVIEFGVASGAGLINIQEVARRITEATGVAFDIYGFDSGHGMPAPQSYRDHPELYQLGDFPMDRQALSQKLRPNVSLVLGPLSETIPTFAARDFSHSPIGFVSIDVDYYTSTVEAVKVLAGPAANYFPRVMMWLDDIGNLNHNSKCGELAAIIEFTVQKPLRPIEKPLTLRNHRRFKNAPWIDHIYQCHVLDHAVRNDLNPNRAQNVATNAYF